MFIIFAIFYQNENRYVYIENVVRAKYTKLLATAFAFASYPGSASFSFKTVWTIELPIVKIKTVKNTKIEKIYLN